MLTSSRILTIAAATAATLWCATAHANWIETLGVGARPSALGSAFTAVADTPAAIYYNPAGLTQLLGDGRATDQSLTVSLTSINFDTRQGIVSARSNIAPGDTVGQTFDGIFYQPDFPGGFELTESIYVAPFAFTAPYGGFLRFPQDRGDARFSTYESSQIFVNFSPRIHSSKVPQ